MDLNKLFWSSTKVDILKYLVFKRQGISMRALESELPRTFPAIKKQIDSLAISQAIDVDKTANKRAITIKEDFQELTKDILLYALEHDIINLIHTYQSMIDTYFLGKTFGNDIESDLVLIYNNCEKEQVDKVIEEIGTIFKSYFIDMVYITPMSLKERQQRYRLADRFVLRIMREVKEAENKNS